MKRSLLSLLLMTLALPAARAAGDVPGGGLQRDELGRGLDALWRESGQPVQPEGWDIVDRRPLVEDDTWFGGSAVSRSGGFGIVPTSPRMRDRVSVVAGTGFRASVTTTRAGGGLFDQSPPNRWASSAAYETGSWRAFAAVERAEGRFTPSSTDQGLRVGAAYRRAGTQLSAGWETASHDAGSSDAAQKAWWIGLAQRVGDGALKINFARTLDASVGAASINGARQIALGYEHGLSAQTAIYAFYTRLSNDPNGLFQLGGGEIDSGPMGFGRSGISLGIRHSF